MLGFLIAAAAGFLTPQITQSLADPVIKAVSGQISITPGERTIVGFMLAMMGAAIASALLQSGTPFGVVAGGVLGYFGTRIVAALQKLINGTR